MKEMKKKLPLLCAALCLGLFLSLGVAPAAHSRGGGMGSHLMLKIESGTVIEVHLASVDFTKLVEVNLQKGDAVEVTGWKTQLDDVDAIFAREVRHGTDVFTFRTKDGKPAW